MPEPAGLPEVCPQIRIVLAGAQPDDHRVRCDLVGGAGGVRWWWPSTGEFVAGVARPR